MTVNVWAEHNRQVKVAKMVAQALTLGYTWQDLDAMPDRGWMSLSDLAGCVSYPSELTQSMTVDVMRAAAERVPDDPFEGLGVMAQETPDTLPLWVAAYDSRGEWLNRWHLIGESRPGVWGAEVGDSWHGRPLTTEGTETASQVAERRAHAYDLPPVNHPHYQDAVARRVLNARNRARAEYLIAHETAS